MIYYNLSKFCLSIYLASLFEQYLELLYIITNPYLVSILINLPISFVNELV